MNMVFKLSPILFIIGIIFITGCLKDLNSPVSERSQSDNARLLYYLEDSGDYINTGSMPSLVKADEVHSNINDYLLIDIRSTEEFSSGHIETAINKSHSELIGYMNSIDYKQYPKIVIISNNGQSSAYYACLLRLYGFENVFSMNFGMASWNNDFAGEWFSALDQYTDFLTTFNLDFVPKPDYSPLPEVTLSGTSLSESVKQRISDLIRVDFEDYFTRSSGTATIDFGYLGENMSDYFIVCYDMGLLYRHLLLGIAHPDGAVLYTPPSVFPDLSSTTNLQTLPSDKSIVFYSADGQLSAFAVAYLRVLGYDVRSVLFGANNMFYNILSGAAGLSEETFSGDKIFNYPYVTGN